MRSEICSVCDQEVRRGWRHGREAYWHRTDVDHQPVFGNMVTPEITAAALAAKIAQAEDDEEEHELEPIEVRTLPLPESGRVLVGCPDGTVAVAAVPGGARIFINLAAKVGWTITRLTYARGPYLGAKGKSLGVSDSVVLHLQGPVVDGDPLRAVGSWRDGKSDFAYRVHHSTRTRVGARALTDWMKENPSES